MSDQSGVNRTPRRVTAYGLSVTTNSNEAVRLYDLAVNESMEFGAQAGELFNAATEQDDGFALAWAGLAMHHFMRERFAEARVAAAKAEKLVVGAHAWEQRHVTALARFCEGRASEAAAQMVEALREEPRDLLLFMRLFFIHFWRGESAAMLRVSSPIFQTMPRDSYVMGMHAFALEECRDYAAALPLGEASLAANPKNAWAVHAVAHIHYEQGNLLRGSTFLPPAIAVCDHIGYFKTHLLWHWALFELSGGRYGQVSQLYRDGIRARGFEMPAEVHDAASLLWRLKLYGAEPEAALWDELANVARERIERPNMLFHHLHLAMTLAGAGDDSAVRRHRAFMAGQAAKNATIAEVGLPLFDGLVAYANGDFQRAVDQIAPIEARIIEVGGSHAQREVFYDTLLEATLRVGAVDRAEVALRERLEHLPEAGRHWYRLGAAQAARGDSAAARASLNNVLNYWRDADADAPEMVGAAALLARLN